MGRPIYLIENWINDDTLVDVSTEDSSGFYNKENLFNKRPSKPWRSEGSGSAALMDEWVCIDLGSERKVTFAGVFNHNLTISPTEFWLFGRSDCGCPNVSGGCDDWDTFPSGIYSLGLSSEIVGTKCRFPNTYKRLSNKDQYWMFYFDDTEIDDGYIEVGELVLGQWQEFGSKVRLQPGRADGPIYYRGDQMTHYGQMWPAYYSKAEHFGITFKNINDADVVDELHCFLDDVMSSNGGRFVWAPDRDKPFCYYVKVMNSEDFAQRLMYGENKELREWTMELRTLTRGISLL